MCDFILTRGPRKNKICGGSLSTLTKCRHHKNKSNETIHTCVYVGPRTNKQCTKTTPGECYKFCPKHQEVINSNVEKTKIKNDKKNKKTNELEELLKLRDKYQNTATDKYLELFNLSNLSPDICQIIEYNNEPVLDKYGRLLSGPCIKFNSDDRYQVHQSPMGTGKTYQMMQFILQNLDKKILLISSRVSSGDDLYSNILKICPDFNHYKYYQIENGCPDKFVIQAESLHKINILYDILVIDECTSLRTQMASPDTHKMNITVNQKILDFQLKNCEKIVFMDAVILQSTLTYYKSFIGESKLMLYKNTFIDKNKPVVELFKGDINLFTEIIVEKLENGKKICFVTNGVNKGLEIEALIKNKIDNLNYVYYRYDFPFPTHLTDTGNIYNVNDDFVKYNLVMYSPTIQQGVDFNITYFDEMFCYFTNMSNSIIEFIQQLGRIRFLNDNKINIFYNVRISQKEYLDVYVKHVKYFDSKDVTYPSLELKHINKMYCQRSNVVNSYLKNYLDNDSFIQIVDGFFETCYRFSGPFKKHFLLLEHEKKLSEVSGEKGLRKVLLLLGFRVRKGCSNLKEELTFSEIVKANELKYIQLQLDINKEIKFCSNIKICSTKKYNHIKKICSDGRIGLELEKMKLYPDFNPQELELKMKKDIYLKRRYQLTVLNEYQNHSTNDNITDIFLMDIMKHEYSFVKHIKNSLFERAVFSFLRVNNLYYSDIHSLLLGNELEFNKFKVRKQLYIYNFQMYYMTLKLLKEIGIKLDVEFDMQILYNNEDKFKQLHNFHNSNKIEEDKLLQSDALTFINIILKKWKGYYIKVVRKTTKRVNEVLIHVNMCMMQHPVKNFNEYIDNCYFTDNYNKLVYIYNSYHLKNDSNFQLVEGMRYIKDLFTDVLEEIVPWSVNSIYD